MLRKSSFVSGRNFCLLSISALFIFSLAATPAQAAKKDETQKGAVSLVVPATKASTEATKVQKEATEKTKSAAAKIAPGTRININTADQVTLEKLLDIGPVKAKAIILGRPYNAVEDIMRVKGIKGKTFERIRDYIVVK